MSETQPSIGKMRSKPPSLLACIACRRSHLKCDGVKPLCSRCADKSLECVWMESRRGYRGQSNPLTWTARWGAHSSTRKYLKPDASPNPVHSALSVARCGGLANRSRLTPYRLSQAGRCHQGAAETSRRRLLLHLSSTNRASPRSIRPGCQPCSCPAIHL
jgi:hypothetical protein